MSNRNNIIPNIYTNKANTLIIRQINPGNMTKSKKSKKNKNNNNNVKSKIELLRNWINEKFYKGKIQYFCDSREMFCQGAAVSLYKKLLNPINQIFLKDIIGADIETLLLMQGYSHFYITIKIKNKLIYIDPTFGQFVKTHNKIFVGTINEIRQHIKDPKDLTEFEQVEGYPPPSVADSYIEFLKKEIMEAKKKKTTNLSLIYNNNSI